MSGPRVESRVGTLEGRAARALVARRDLAALAPRPARDDPMARLAAATATRVPGLATLRAQRMAESPFAFLRGSALLMAEDLAAGASTPLEVPLCGDAHVANFGVFTSPEGRQVFDINDFDETAVGPFEWDVKRLTVSLGLVAQANGLGPRRRRALVLDAARAYQSSMTRFASLTRLEVWYAALDVAAVLEDLRGYFHDESAETVRSVVGGAVGPSPSAERRRFVERAGDAVRIRLRPPLLSAVGAHERDGLASREDLAAVLEGYAASLTSDRRALLAQFTVLDVARLVRGVGSVGTQCFAVLLAGRDLDDLFFLQVKEARRSVLDVARGRDDAVEPGERVVTGQRLLQATPDELLGWHSRRIGGEERSFYVRQLYDHQASVALERLDERQLRAYGRVCAWTLARAHARSGRAGEIAGYLGANDRFATSLSDFAESYRERVREDFHAFASTAGGRATTGS